MARRFGFDVLGSVTLAQPWALGVGFPLFVAQTGGDSPSSAGVGDLRIVPKLRILDDRNGLGLGLVAELRAPTHSGDFSGGARNLVFAPRFIVDHRFDDGWRVGLNAGVLVREATRFYNLHAGSEFTYAGACSHRFGDGAGKVEIGAELVGALGLVSSSKFHNPLEWFYYLKLFPRDEWELVGGAAMGLTAGYGTPSFRAFFGMRFTPGVPREAEHVVSTLASHRYPSYRGGEH